MTPLLLIGCGNMGGALLTRWCESLAQEFSPIAVVEPHAVALPQGVMHVPQVAGLPEDFMPEVIVLAVKPQSLADILPGLAKKFGTGPTYLSIAAGKTLSFFEERLGQGASVVRAMPNTPSMIGEGITALVGNKSLTDKGRAQATRLMGAVGDTLWLEEESMMDAVTAISGSGPAYFFAIIECMVNAGVKQGLSQQAATQLAVKTCLGSARLALQSEKSLTDLRVQVTSPGGTTAAALAVFQKDNALQMLIDSAVGAAVKRAREL